MRDASMHTKTEAERLIREIPHIIRERYPHSDSDLRIERDDRGYLQIVRVLENAKARRTLSYMMYDHPDFIPFLVETLGYDLDGPTRTAEEGAPGNVDGPSDVEVLFQWTIDNGNIALVEWLIAQSVPMPSNAMWQACSGGHFDMMNYLVERDDRLPDTGTAALYTPPVQEWIERQRKQKAVRKCAENMEATSRCTKDSDIRRALSWVHLTHYAPPSACTRDE